MLLQLAVGAASAQVWTSIGPTPPSQLRTERNVFNNGRIAAVAVDPSDQRHWLIGAGNGGVWETRDAGTSFVPLSDGWPTLAVGSIAFAPNDPAVIYVGTGEPVVGFGHAGLGLMKSTDGGQTWTQLAESTFTRAAVKRLRVHPRNPDVVIAATLRAGFGRDAQSFNPAPPPFGVLKSSDGGATWKRTLAGQVTALEIDATNFSSQYAAVGDSLSSEVGDTRPGDLPNGIYRSTDAGETWTAVSGPWGLSSARQAVGGRIEMAMAPSNPNVVYVSIQAVRSNSGLKGLYKTENAWSATPSWIQIPTDATGGAGKGYCGPHCDYVHVISVDPTNPNTLFAGGEHLNLWRCTECSASPQWVNRTPSVGDHHVLAWAENRLINGQDHGVWSTLDGGSTWQNHNATLSIATFYSGVVHPTTPDVVMGGLRDLNGVRIRMPNGIWRGVPAREPEFGEAEVAMSSLHPDTDWMAGWLWGAIGRTVDGGGTWTVADSGIDKTGSSFVAPVRKCPSNDDIFLTGTNRLWRTDNFFSSPAPTWRANAPASSFTNLNSPAFPGTILGIEFLASDITCNTYVYGTRGGQFRLTRDGGVSWTDLDPGKNLPARGINGFAFDPVDPNVLYVALSSFDEATPDRPGHVFKTAGALSSSPSWVNVSPPSNQPFNVIRIGPNDPHVLYAGSDTGLWRSTDGATTWVHDGPESGIPNVSIYDISIHPTTGAVAVFTYGRGAFGLGFSTTR